MIIDKCVIRHSRNSIEKPNLAIVLLPGRGCSAEGMMEIFLSLVDLPKLIIFSLEPSKEWYPIPNGIEDQNEAVSGLSENLSEIKNYIDELLIKFGIEIESTILIGFSAGSVVALTLATYYQQPYKIVFSHSGAILETENVKDCEIKTKFFLIHHEDDYCFDWHERYMPMRESLRNHGYDVTTVERSFGNHVIYRNDVEYIKQVISESYS